MHIVLVCREYVGSARGGGIGSYMEEIAKAYVKLGHRVTVVTASDDTREENVRMSPEGIRIRCLSGGDFLVESVEGRCKWKKLRAIYRFSSYRKHVSDVLNSLSDIDIVEVADYGAEALYLSDLKVPVVIRLHTPQSLSRATLNIVHPKWWQIHRLIPLRAERRIFSQARYITGCSQAILNWVGDNFDISRAMTAVVNNPVAIAKKRDDVAKPAPSEVKTIFYAGTICDTKGVGDLVSACRILKNRGMNIQLRLAGKGGSYQTALMKQAEENHWDWLVYLGKLSRPQVYENYTQADVCCFPSWWENMPMVCLESMALGAVVVSTDAGGTPEIIQDGFNGFLTHRKQPEDLALALEKALTMDDTERRRISSNAQETIRAKFSTDYIAGEMLNYFERVIFDFKNSSL